MIGSLIGSRYELVREIGRGGMGVVYLANDPMLEREVAIKIIPPAHLGSQTMDRFRREARTLAKMDHPSIVVVYDTGEHEGSMYYVMPLVRGSTLRQFLKERSYRLRDVLDIAVAVAEALDYSHTLGVVHRDVKPENILIARDPSGGIRVRVTDFGLAIDTTVNRLTQSDSLVGTVSYLSPEQISRGVLDGRSDLYSLATVLYECFAGETPFTGALANALYRIVHERPMTLRERGVDVDPELEMLIMQCLEKDPARRPATGRQIADVLRRCMARLPEHLTGSLKHPAPREDSQTARLDPLALSELVGRSEEVGELQRRLDRAMAGECQFVVIGGDAGIGKTRLLEELHRMARLRRVRTVTGRFVEHERGFAFQGFCDLIIDCYHSRTATDSSVLPDLSDLLPDLMALFPVLGEVERLRSVSSVHISDFERRRKIEDRTEIFELLARTLTRIGSGRPLVILLEELHVAEVSLDALQYIVSRLGPTPTLVVGTYRASAIDKRHPIFRMIAAFEGDRRFASLELGPLEREDHRRFVEMSVSGTVTDSLAARLFEATEGNPFFTKELIRSLLDGNAIRRDGDLWSMHEEEDQAAEWLPATIQQAIERRIETLGEDQRRVLSMAAVIGRSFEVRELSVLAEDRDHVEDVIDALIAAGFIEEERESRGDRFTFSSAIVRDVLYNALPRRRRRALHQRFAESLEKKHSGRLQRVYSQLLHHFAHADVQEKVIDYGLRLAQRGLEAFAPEEVLRAGRLVLEFLEEDNPAHVPLYGEARIVLARAHRLLGNIDAALRELTEAARLFERESEAKRLLDTLAFAAETAWEGRRTEETRRWVDSACRLARIAGASDVLRRLLPLGATVANLRGDHELAAQYLAEADALQKSQPVVDDTPRGGTLRVALVAQLHTRDPIEVTLAEEEEVLSNVFETLVARGRKGNLIPALAEQWEVQDQGRAVTLTVRSGVKLHDGRTLDAGLVKNALDRILAHPAATGTPALAAIAENGVEVLGPREVRINLREPISIFPAMLTHERTAIALPAQSPDPVTGETQLVGTGRFCISSFTPGEVLLERNDDYRGTPAYVDGIQFRIVASAAEIAEQFRAGIVDIARDLLPEDLEEILRHRKRRASVVESPKSDVYFVLVNRNGRIGEHPEARAALCRSVRLDDLVWRTLGRFAEPADGFIPPTILGRGLKRRPWMSHEAATEAIANSGLSSPVPLRAAVHPVLQDRYGSLTRTLFEAWKKIGLDVEIVTPDMKSYLAAIRDSSGIDLLIGRFVADYDDPDNFIFGLLHSEKGIFREYYSSSELDRLAVEGRTQSAHAARERIYRRIEALLAESDAVLPLFHDVDYRVASPMIQGLELGSIPPYVNYGSVWKVDTTAEARRTAASITIPVTGEIMTLDPSETFLLVQTEVMPTIFETLTKQNESAQIVPFLAAEFTPEDGGRRFRFRLRDGIRFHDGRRLTSRDVRHSFERALRNDASKRRSLLGPVSGARALMNGEASELTGITLHSALEFSIELEQPMSFFPALLAYEAASIVPEGENDFTRTAIGTGAFRVVRFDAGRRLDLEANPYYWRRDLPRIDHLTFIFGTSPAEIAEGFAEGRYAMAWDLFPADVERFRTDARLGAKYSDTPLLSTAYLAFNARRGPMADESLRRMVAASLDTEALVRRHMGRLAILAHGMIPPGLIGHESRGRDRHRTPPPPQPTELTYLMNSVFDGAYSSFADGFRESLARRRITLRNLASMGDRAGYFGAIERGECDLVLTRWVADYPDADTFMHDILHTRHGFVGGLCGSAEMDELIERARTEPNPARRHALYREVESILHEQVLVIPLFHEQAYRFTRPDIENLQLHFGAPAVRYEEVSVARTS